MIDYNYIIIGKEFYYKNNTLYKQVYNFDLKQFVYIVIDDNISLYQAYKEATKKMIITQEMLKDYILSMD